MADRASGAVGGDVALGHYRPARRRVAAIPPPQPRTTYHTPLARAAAAAVHSPHVQLGSWPRSSSKRRRRGR
jgi:hypothetical protein